MVVSGSFPEPLVEPLKIEVGVIYPSDFKNHEIYDEAKTRSDSDWVVKTGEAQVEFWTGFLSAFFEKAVFIDNEETLVEESADLEAILIPSVAQLEYSVPNQSNVNIYEIWMRYSFQLMPTDAVQIDASGEVSFDPSESIATWYLTAYGKTPTALLQSSEEAVNLAAIVALRDAGAHFVTTFTHVPGIEGWLKQLGGLPPSGTLEVPQNHEQDGL